MAKAHKLPSGSYRVQVYAGKTPAGKHQYVSITRRTKQEAEYEAAQYRRHYREISRDMTAMTLGEAMERYVSGKDGVLSPSTIRGYEGIRKKHLQGLMSVRLNRLTPALIQEAINEASKPYRDERGRVRERSPKTIRNIYGLLTAVLGEYHPTLKLNTTLPQAEQKEQRILEPEEIGRLLRAVEGDEMELPVLLGLWLCMRESEIMGLRWESVDLDRGLVTIRRALVRDKENRWVEKGTKTTGSTRTMRVPEYILEKLKRAREEASGERVVELTGGGMYKRLQRILRKSGLPAIRFHDLRHTAASVMLTLNIPDKYAQARGGWTTAATMKRTYQHTMRAKREAVDAAIDNYYNGLLRQVEGEASDKTCDKGV